MKTRQEVFKILSQHLSHLKNEYGVEKIGVFGSVARDEQTAVSDVDIVVELQKPDLFYLVHIKEELEEALHCPVDIVHYRKHMNDFLKKRIEKDVVYV